MSRQLTIIEREGIESSLHEAADAIMGVYRSGDNRTELKADNSPVTVADLMSEKIIMDSLKRITPGIPLLSEESAAGSWQWRRKEKLLWILDPMDGTREFIARNDQFCICLALIEEGVPVAGFIMIPVEGSLWYAHKGEGVFRLLGTKREEIHCAPAGKSLKVLLSRSHMVEAEDMWLKKAGSTIGLETEKVGSAIKFCRLAEGSAGIYPKAGPINDWDIAAGHILVTESGGEMVTTDGLDIVRYNRELTRQNGFIAMSAAVARSGIDRSLIYFPPLTE